MKFDGIEHFDICGNEVIFWADLSDPPPQIKERAMAIDGGNYSPSCYGMCIGYDPSDQEVLGIVTDTERSTGRSCSIYYIDNDGDKHWFPVDLPEGFVGIIFAECRQILDGKKLENGYIVRESISFDDGRGFVLAENPELTRTFITARFTAGESGIRDYEKKEYYHDKDTAERDFTKRSQEYKTFNRVNELAQAESPNQAKEVERGKQKRQKRKRR